MPETPLPRHHQRSHRSDQDLRRHRRTQIRQRHPRQTRRPIAPKRPEARQRII